MTRSRSRDLFDIPEILLYPIGSKFRTPPRGTVLPELHTLRPLTEPIRLFLADGHGQTGKYGPEIRTIEIGRNPQTSCLGEATFVIDRERVSRRHARLLIAPDGTVKLIDVDSTFGTELNGCHVSPSEPVDVKDGDSIKLSGANEL